jgi:prepilin-type N-terminal cleavage/methylation domain-containing protein
LSRSCRTRSKARGFTLLELLVVVAVSAALIALLGLVYRQVQRTGQGLGAAESDWQVQVFLRRQIAARDERFDPLALNEGDTTSLRLVSRYSAAHAMAGPPVLAHYLFLPNQERLVYRETPLPPWWTDGQSAVAFRSATLADATLTSNEQVLLAGVTALRFAYGDGSDTGWRDSWLLFADSEPPPLVRLRFDRLGSPVEWMMPTRHLRYALPLPALSAEAEAEG